MSHKHNFYSDLIQYRAYRIALAMHVLIREMVMVWCAMTAIEW